MKRYSSLFLGGAASLLLAACPAVTDGDGGVEVNLDVAGLLSNQSFCMTWDLYQAKEDGWELIDARTEPICAADGVDYLSDFATCYDGLRFLVRYDITFYGPEGEIGTAQATSGGGPEDLCVKNTDTNTRALVQFNNQGSAGGVNPGIEIDQVCANDKLELEDGQLVSALWLQPEDCEAGIPDEFCAIGFGEGLTTVRTGLTLDGLTRYIFSTAPLDAVFSVFYGAFDAGLEPGVLHLYNSPWILNHYGLGDGVFGRRELEGVFGMFRLDNPSSISVGGVALDGEEVVVIYDLTGSCNAAISLDGQEQRFAVPACGQAFAEPLGVIETGGAGFSVIFECQGDLIEIPCSANGLNGGICDPS